MLVPVTVALIDVIDPVPVANAPTDVIVPVPVTPGDVIAPPAAPVVLDGVSVSVATTVRPFPMLLVIEQDELAGGG